MLAYLNRGERTPRPFSTPRPAPVIAGPAIPRPAPAAPRSDRVAAERPASTPTVIPAAPRASGAAPATGSSDASPAADQKAVLLKIAADLTGYPEDMLGLGLNMEADLGIDSIKRTEILGAFRKAQPPIVSEFLKPRMAQIAKAKTFQEVLDSVRASLSEMEGGARPFDHAGGGHRAALLTRYVMRPAVEALPAGQPTSAPAGVYLVVPDRRGIAAELTALLESDGAKVRLAPPDVATDDVEIEAWLASARAAGKIRGLICLAGANPAERGLGEAAEWREGMDTSIKSLFALLRLSEADLADDGIVTVASVMGGQFGRDILRRNGHADFFAGAGGGVGLIKCLAAEWPGCRCKAIDLDPDEEPARHAAHIHAEIAAPAGRREVGYPGGVRTIFRTELAQLPMQGAALARPGPDWVVLAVGGARGITAETCRPFASAGAACVVVGRSAAPEPESKAMAGVGDAAALRKLFLAEAAATATLPTPAKIEARIAAVLRNREILANFADFASLGGRLDYRVCDVRNEAEVVALLESVYARYGRIDAVLFGAGLIEDRLIVDKTRESLSRVFDTKVDGAFFFARHIRPQTLKFLALFSSVAGRYGNRGQTDYGAANEVLNRFAWQLQSWLGESVKVTAVNWGAWARTTNGPGMLTPETARQFRERGLRLIEPHEGCGFLWNELLYAPREDVEVVAGEHAWDELEAEAAHAPTRADPTKRAVA
jgi:NAD(P)-dependent dehydrogenase (short-subunit alcohol dehydrogenase family)